MPDARPEQPQRLPDHVTMPLLTLITTQSLDSDYAHAAARRGGSNQPRSRKGPGAVLAVLALFGILVATAAAQTSRDAAVDQTNRAALISQLEARRAALADVQERIGRLHGANAVTEDRLTELAQQEQAVRADLRRLATRTGYGSATGPGIKVVVSDSTSGLPDDTVRDSDLALLADALWGVGAEAIAVNGQRLTVRSGFRNVGPAVHVNGVPLSPPYVFDVIGDPRQLQASLVESAQGQQFQALVDTYDFGFEMTNADSLDLPAAPMRSLRWAARAGTGDNEPDRQDSGPAPSEGETP